MYIEGHVAVTPKFLRHIRRRTIDMGIKLCSRHREADREKIKTPVVSTSLFENPTNESVTGDETNFLPARLIPVNCL